MTSQPKARDVYDGRRAWAKTHLGESPLNKAEAHRVAHKLLLLRADTDAKAKAAWEGLYNERNRLWREEADRVGAVKLLLEANGCDCDCDHHHSEHDDGCDRCLACRISWAIET
jgi:hypothetical protein